eukprot:gene3893-4503_t
MKHRFLVVGLGNPGREYILTRHNIGFMAVDRLAQLLRTDISTDLKSAHVTTTYLTLDERIRKKTKESKEADAKAKKEQEANNKGAKEEAKETEEEDDEDDDVATAGEVVNHGKRPKKMVYEVVLAKPMRYMNLSGRVVLDLCQRYNVAKSNVIVLVDDMALDLGKTRLREKGQSGGQNGLEDIILRLGTEKVSRLRIGVGQPRPGEDRAAFVLKRFPLERIQQVSEATDRAAKIALMWIEQGPQLTMTQTNN